MEQWSLHMSRGDMCNMHVYCSLPPHSRVTFAVPHEHRIPVDP